MRCTHQLLLELLADSSGESLAKERVDPAVFKPAQEALAFRAMRERAKPAVFGDTFEVMLRPSMREAPKVDDLILESTGTSLVDGAPLSLLDDQAATLVAALRARGAIDEKETCSYRLLAFEAPLAEPERRPLAIREEPWDLPVTAGSMAALELSRANTLALSPRGEDFPVFVPEHVLEEARGLADAAGDVETGGILLGRLRYDEDAQDLFLEVSAQLPARHTQQESKKLTFTPETWNDLAAAVELRGRGEIYVGWWHFHPSQSWCRECSPASRAVCPYNRPFFSADDRNLHRTVFGRPFNVGLLLGDRYDEASDRWSGFEALFGWRRGEIVERDFHRTSALTSPASGSLSGDLS